ncbi:MAG: group 1 truncated hemoglobin [Alphaproteobacteria bacterium]|nr:MAG: group 1 truncated hemoglobin [Alphaproteobacteria bacterium]
MTLLDQIGGQDSVDAAVDAFYVRVLADDRINGFFKINMDVQAAKQKRFLGKVLAGTAKDPDGYMRAAHKKLVEEDGLNDGHFDAVAEHLQAALESLGVEGDVLNQIMTAIGGLRKPMLNQ